ncbi:MAG: AsmA family protein [Rhodobacteraceae bacterium]|nr:AsmA family protein [Paracoccaceae bacterium]
MRLIKALVAAAVMLVVLVVGVFIFMPTERIAAIATQQFEASTGRSLSIGGSVRPSFYPVIGARALDVQLGNPDWAGEGPMLRAAEMDIGLNLAMLIRGDIQIERVVLQSPQLHLRRDADGRVNWDLGSRSSDTPSSDAGSGGDAISEPAVAPRARRITLNEAEIRDGSLRFEDAIAGTDLELEALGASLRIPDMAGPADLVLSGRLNGQTVALTLNTDSAERMLEGRTTTVMLDLEAAGAQIAYAGRAGLDGLVAEGRVQAHVPQPRALMRMLGQAGGEVASDWLPLGVTADLTRTADGLIYLRDGQFRAGAMRLRGAADLDPRTERPGLTAQLAGDVVDLRSSGNGGSGSGGSGSGTTADPGWSREVIDASALGLIDADIRLTLDGLRTDLTTLGRTDLSIAIDRARAVTTLREVALFGGVMTGEFVMNNRSGLSVGGDLRLRDVDLLPLLTDLADYRRLQGSASADLQFLGVGNTMHDIMNSLRGEGALRFAQGEIIGFDLAGMLRNLDMSYMGEGNRTVYQSINGTFSIADGVLRNDDLRLDSSRLSVTGRGSVGLGARTLDYRIVPAALRDAETELLRVPLMITGPWDAPRFRLDIEAMAQERLRVEQERLEEIAREEARRLEERARREAEDQLQRRLGVEREEGERLEDSLRRGVEEEVGSRIRGLLGRN